MILKKTLTGKPHERRENTRKYKFRKLLPAKFRLVHASTADYWYKTFRWHGNRGYVIYIWSRHKAKSGKPIGGRVSLPL